MSHTLPTHSFPQNSSSNPPNQSPISSSKVDVPLETPFEKFKRKIDSSELPPEVHEILNAYRKRAQRLALYVGCASSVGTAFLLKRNNNTPSRIFLFSVGSGFLGMQVGKIIGAVLGARDILKLPNPEIHKILKDLRDEVQNRRSPAPFPPPNSSWEKIRKQNTEQTATVSSSLPTEDAVIISNPPEKMKNLEPNPQKSKKYNQYGDEIE